MKPQDIVKPLRRLGDRLNALRVDRDMTQAELAATVGMSTSFLAGVETAQTNAKGEPIKVPSLRMLCRIAKVLGCELEDLFAEVEPEEGDV